MHDEWIFTKALPLAVWFRFRHINSTNRLQQTEKPIYFKNTLAMSPSILNHVVNVILQSLVSGLYARVVYCPTSWDAVQNCTKSGVLSATRWPQSLCPLPEQRGGIHRAVCGMWKSVSLKLLQYVEISTQCSPIKDDTIAHHQHCAIVNPNVNVVPSLTRALPW